MRGTLVLLAACGSPAPTEAPPTPIVLEGPSVATEGLAGPVETGASMLVSATATDPDGVDALELHVRREGELSFTLVPMEPVDDRWEAAIPTDVVGAPGVEYWIRAYDASDWRVPSAWPDAGAADPARVSVLPVARTAPYEEGFAGTTSYAWGLYELGWSSATLGFRGERWRIGGDGFAVHPAGYAGVPAFDGWLVSPTIDLVGIEAPEVRWRERGGAGTPARHSLWASTGSPDPADGDFVEVAELAPPEDRWTWAPVADLAAFGGKRVTLAWRYEGTVTAAWSIDDVRVGGYGPDVRVVGVEQPQVDPGATDVLRVTLENPGAPSGPVTLDGAALDGWVGFNTPVPLGSLGNGARVVVDLPFAVAAQQPDNHVVQTDLLLDDGDQVTRWPYGLLVGHPTTGRVRLSTDARGTVDIRVGSGDPRMPHAEEPVLQGILEAGEHALTVDLGEHVDLLPSTPGRLRWFVRVRSQAAGRFLRFGIDFDGSLVESAAGGRIEAGQEAIFWLPDRPDPALTGLELDPDPLIPGQPGHVRLGLQNLGGATSGALVAWPRSLHPDLAVTSLPVVIAPGAWERGEQAVVEVPVTVAASHTDSTPLPLALDLLDDAESFAVSTDVPVPWPSVGIGSVLVGGDGVLDPDETAHVLITVRNDGALSTGPMTCTLASTGPAATVTGGTNPYGDLPPGSVALQPTTVTAVGGSPGDTLPLVLTCVGDRGTWVLPVSLALGGVPWAVLPLDPAGDALPGASLDLREARWRRDAGTLTVELTAAGPIAPDPVVELWMHNPGSTFQAHVVTLGPTGAALYGVRQQGWTPLGTPTVAVDGSILTVDLLEADLALVDPQLSIAAGTGFCGAAGYHCDQWPDGWGNPWVPPLDTSTWPVMAW